MPMATPGQVLFLCAVMAGLVWYFTGGFSQYGY
jgi:hypothetical protein